MPSGSGETQRASWRSGNVLQVDRMILRQTRGTRGGSPRLGRLDALPRENLRTILHELIGRHSLDYEAVSDALVAYGKDMYQLGKYGGFF